MVGLVSDSPQNESAVAKWLRNPLLVGVTILSTVAGAFRIAGVSSMLIANLMLIAGVWMFITLEVWCSKWIRRTGRYSGAVILSTSLISGTASVGLARTIANLKKQQIVEAPVPSPLTPVPVPNPAPTSGPVLKVARYETLPYRAGEPLKVRMFVDNVGSSSITLFGGSHSSFVDKLPSDYNERRQLERRLWTETAKYTAPKDRPLKFQTLTTFADLMSEQALSQEQIDRLAKGSVMYLMTVLKDQHGKMIITSCVHTDPAGSNLFFCVDHNTP